MVAAGPKISVSFTACAFDASSTLSSVGETKADLAWSMPSSVGACVLPQTIVASFASLPIPCNTLACCARLTTGPMRVASVRGSPTVILASRADSASATAPARSAGASTRRMAVHFWPALTVISRATSLMKASNAGVPGPADGASRAAFTVRFDIHHCPACQDVAVAANAACCIRGAGKRDHIVASDMIEHIADAAAQKAERPFRQDTGTYHITHHLVTEEARRRGRFRQHRHAGEQRAGRLLPQPPAREIEGVNMQGCAVARRE